MGTSTIWRFEKPLGSSLGGAKRSMPRGSKRSMAWGKGACPGGANRPVLNTRDVADLREKVTSKVTLKGNLKSKGLTGDFKN